MTRHLTNREELGCNQKGVLRALRSHGGRYSENCGWLWGTHRETVVILNSLVRRGLVKAGNIEGRETWLLAEERRP